MNGIEQLLKTQSEWFKKVSHEVAGKPGEFVKELSDQLQREGVTAARDRVERLEAQREAINRRVDTAIRAEKSLIERLESKLAETRPEAAGGRARAAPAATAAAVKKAASPRKAAATAKAATPRKAAATKAKAKGAQVARAARKTSKPK
jgi:predicted component of type VI protein secretion system